tara:strand:+ start:1303 stop:2118 length:816 start_codon:yes stop_codon:yes gene_type:complete
MTKENQPHDERIPEYLRVNSGRMIFHHNAKNIWMHILHYKDTRGTKRNQIPGFSREMGTERTMCGLTVEESYREDIREECLEARAAKDEAREISGCSNSRIRELIEKYGLNTRDVKGAMEIRRMVQKKAVEEASKPAEKLHDKLEAEIKERGVDRPVSDIDYLTDLYISKVYPKKTYPESISTGHLERTSIISPEMEPTVAEFNGLVAQVEEMQDPAKVDRDKLDELLLQIGERVRTYTQTDSAVKFYELYDQLGRTPNFEELKEILGEEE